MISPFQTIASSLLAFSILPLSTPGEPADEAIARATGAIEAAVPRAQADPARPIFHVTSPAQWMNDPNGPIFYKGVYHLFYQLSPFSDGGGPKYWGHVRSRDLAKWEALPIALCPATEAAEAEVWSGCCTINGLGQPMIFYTSIAPGQSAQTHAEQWAALGDDNLIKWHRSAANPVLSESLHGGKKIYDWRDPFVFRCGAKTFLVAGGNLNQARGGQAVVNIYEAKNAELTQWEYRGVMFNHPDASAATSECPNFFKLGDQWVLFVSPYGKVQYFVGDFDPETCRFHPRTRGVLDYGTSFYAPNTMQVPDGRRLVWGWVKDFPGGRGWNGCLSVPRELRLSGDGQLRQMPAPELTKLRGKAIEWRNIPLESGWHTLELPKTNTLEIHVDFDMKTANSITFSLNNGTNDPRPVIMNLSASEFKMMDAEAPLALGEARQKLNVFIDRSVLEVFINGTVCATKIISPLGGNPILEISAQGGAAEANLVQAWPMKTIW